LPLHFQNFTNQKFYQRQSTNFQIKRVRETHTKIYVVGRFTFMIFWNKLIEGD